MRIPKEQFSELYTPKGDLFGVFISPEIWGELEDTIRPLIEKICGEEEEICLPEPLADWVELKEWWDFPYPIDTDVACPECGNASDDWEADDPRKFHLKNCNLGGLVSFECISCKARVIKRHFKDGIQVDSIPATK